MYISDFFYIWKTNRMMLFCNLFIERPSTLVYGKFIIQDRLTMNKSEKKDDTLKEDKNHNDKITAAPGYKQDPVY